uniref:Uncharacterized protein n=1 Tax=Rhizophora mucronata TaxID=61149 RepID=A0A2P2QM82_RHIMU
MRLSSLECLCTSK